MNENDYQIFIVIALIISLAILYFIIKGAIKKATEKQSLYLKTLVRLKVLELRKQGFSNKELADIINMGNADFVSSLLQPDLEFTT